MNGVNDLGKAKNEQRHIYLPSKFMILVNLQQPVFCKLIRLGESPIQKLHPDNTWNYRNKTWETFDTSEAKVLELQRAAVANTERH
eukprot:6352732-Heterocapsa_arctica.AAC.1